MKKSLVFGIILLGLIILFAMGFNTTHSITGKAIAQFCSDSDNGIDIYTAGFVKTTAKNPFYDKCYSKRNPKNKTQRLYRVKEWYCEGTKKKNKQIACPTACFSGPCNCTAGACSPPDCFETDLGMNMLIAGALYNSTGKYIDTCIGTTTLKEYYCGKLNESLQADKNCDYAGASACSDGKCTGSDSSLVLLSHFDSFTGMDDISGFARKGRCNELIQSCPSVGSGPNGAENAYQFDGVNDFIKYNKIIAIPTYIQDRSVVAWFKINPGCDNAERFIVAWGPNISAPPGEGVDGYIYGRAFQISVLQNGQILRSSIWFKNSAGYRNIDYSPAYSLCDGGWHFVAVSYSYNASSTRTLYLDGVNVGSISGTTPREIYYTPRYTDLHIGESIYNNGNFKGLIDEVRIYNKALSDTEISTLYSMYLPFKK
jgi:hypothetical protein